MNEPQNQQPQQESIVTGTPTTGVGEPAPVPMMPVEQPKAKWPMIVGVTVLALALAYSAFAYLSGSWPLQNTEVAQETPSPSPTPTTSCKPRPACLDATPACKLPEPIEGWCQTSPTSDWKTYTNTQYGFEFKYPSDWEIIAEQEKIIIRLAGPNPPAVLGILYFEIFSLGTSEKYSIGNWIETTLGGQKAIKKPTAPAMGSPVIYLVANLNRSKEIRITVPSIPSPSTYGQILSTFRFLDAAASTADWKTYTNTELGISVDYLANWTLEDNTKAYIKGVSIYNPADPPSMGNTGNFMEIIIDPRTNIEQIRGLYNGSGTYREEIKTIGDQKAYLYDRDGSVYVYIPYKNKIYLISAAPYPSENIQRSLSSLKFTK